LESNKDEISIDEEWVVNQPQNIEEDDGLPEEIVTKEELNTLEAGMQEWGIDVPGIIGQSTSGPELPPVIGEEPQIMTTTSIGTVEHIEIENVELKPELEVEVEPQLEIEVSQPNKEEIVIDDFPDEIIDVQEEIVENVVPEDDDLEYPDSLKIIEEVSKEETFSSLIPISELSDEVEFSDEIQTDGISLNDTLGTNTEEEIKALEEQIADEVDEEKNLWSTDEVVEEADLQKNNMDMAIERVKASQESQITPTPQIKISEEEIRSRVEELLGPMVERIVREKIDSVIEKVSWEVIPDLAENIIKRELKQVTEEILQDN
jgi:hypothetical protein